jgi:hypothetical protein
MIDEKKKKVFGCVIVDVCSEFRIQFSVCCLLFVKNKYTRMLTHIHVVHVCAHVHMTYPVHGHIFVLKTEDEEVPP